ncbi:calcium-binding protein [Sedimentitalea sp. XS_ASV28]|uniref:calcium-binding protein n=1 Tax=Sedimentitalea sp. XS_ASV28 TaxID=3241296 RepID=UPI0035171497
MPSMYLVANEVFFTSYGHIQFVFDADDSYGSGDEREIEVQPTSLGFGDWDVSPVQNLDIPSGVDSVAVRLDMPQGRNVSDIWDLLANVRDFFAGITVDYRLGITGSIEGQNSNTYITTLAHIVGLDIAPAIATLLASHHIGALPGLDRNVLFDHITSNGSALPPVALSLAGTDGADILAGGDGADTLSGAQGRDILHGFGDNDTLSGGNGHDTILGGDGDDTANGNHGRDRIAGENGDDILSGQGGNDRLTGGAGDDLLRGGAGADWLAGNAGSDRLWGGKDADVLRGGRGHDDLFGQGGDDVLHGMAGNDVMSGGGGSDVFLFDGLSYEGRDEITDFMIGTDILRISGLVFDDIVIEGGDTALIALDDKTEISLNGIPAAHIGASDFEFV